ncbi:uncharacterized protein LOC124285035 [Haliotis rubra]|uniref:uncharacterized protein LOC124285035 n=1 Tax=Haliotis rubra TaxID=36100 RepID=UPI001EE4ED58|nr:uncharacterized protein LOC124285035 [Haliotis rubra]
MNLNSSMDKDPGYWKGEDRLSHDRNPHFDRMPLERSFERGPMLEKQPVGQLNVSVIDYQHKTREDSMDIVERVDKRYSPHDVRDIIDSGPCKKMRYNEDIGQAAYGIERNMPNSFPFCIKILAGMNNLAKIRPMKVQARIGLQQPMLVIRNNKQDQVCGLQNHKARVQCYRCFKTRDKTTEAGPYKGTFYPPRATQPVDTHENVRKRIRVSNLPLSVSAEEMFNVFSECGKIVYANIVIDPATKWSKGFGYVSFNTESEAAYAATRTYRLIGSFIYCSRVKFTEKLSTNYDDISSDEEDSGPMFKCQVDCCGFKGRRQKFHHHWKEIHSSFGKLFICPVCDTGCADRCAMRSHLMQGHGVTNEGGTLDNVLRNVKMELRRNPFYVNPGCSEKEAMVEIGNSKIRSAQKSHKTVKVYKCPETGCVFAALANSFIRHWNCNHLESSSVLTCPVCSVHFVEKAKLIAHFRIEHKIHPYDDVIGSEVAGAEKIRSDEDEEEFKMLSGKYICRVAACDFHGPKSAFRRHWEERHVLNQTYFRCPYCSVGCRNQPQIRYHMVKVHKVQITDPILDDALTRTFAKERRNPNFLDPGNVEREAKIEICVRKPPLSFDQKKTSRSKSAAENLREKKSSKKTTLKTTKEAVSFVNNPPDYLLMKYNGQKADSIKTFLAWTDSLMENLEMAHQKAQKKLQEYDEKNSKHKKCEENSKLHDLKENNSKLEEPDDNSQLKELENSNLQELEKKGDLQEVAENITLKKHEEENIEMLDLENIKLQELAENSEIQELDEDNSKLQDLENSELQNMEDNSELEENTELQEVDEENSELQEVDEENSELQEVDEENSELQEVDEENSELQEVDEENSELQEEEVDEENSELQEVDEENSELQEVDEENSELQEVDEENSELQEVDEENSELQEVDENSELQEVDEENSELQEVDEENSELQEVDEENSELQEVDEENSELQEVDEENSELQEVDEENSELQEVDEENSELQEVDENSELQEVEENSELQEVDEENSELQEVDEENSELQEVDENSELQEVDEENSEIQELDEENSELQELENCEMQDLEENSELQDLDENSELQELEDNSELQVLDEDNSELQDLEENSELQELEENSELQELEEENCEMQEHEGNSELQELDEENSS